MCGLCQFDHAKADLVCCSSLISVASLLVLLTLPSMPGCSLNAAICVRYAVLSAEMSQSMSVYVQNLGLVT